MSEYKSAFKEAHERAAKDLAVLIRVCERRRLDAIRPTYPEVEWVAISEQIDRERKDKCNTGTGETPSSKV